MTKNEDTSPWIHFPNDPKAIKSHNELVLSSIPTADLVAELKGRHELCPVVDEMTREPVCLFVMTTESLVKELSKRNGVLTPEPDVVDSVVYREMWKAVRMESPEPIILVVLQK